MVVKSRHTVSGLLAIGLVVGLDGCASTPPRFALSAPVTVALDTVPVAVPHPTEFDMLTYQSDLVVRRPATEALYLSGSHSARDINAMDELPASTWYTPRLGYREVTPEQLLHAPEETGPPESPFTVVRAKHGGGSPGFIISDRRGARYLVKFDPPERPALETATDLVASRLYWGFGYNVPEDYLFFFERGDLRADPQSGLTSSDVDSVLAKVAGPTGGQYRSTASLIIGGIILGALADQGVRKDDPNDRIPHEDRRILRALRVFGAFTNHTGLRIDNSLDTYVGEPGHGYVKHYLLDFGENLGAHGAGKGWLWDGYSRVFSFGESFRRFVTLGLVVEDWERLAYTRWPSVGAFEATRFDPGKWKTVSPYLPIDRSQADDDYWAVKIVGALTEEHIRTLVDAAEYPDPGATEYVVATLMGRWRKVLSHFLSRVSPLEQEGYARGGLQLRDVRRTLLGEGEGESRYEVRYLDDRGREIAPAATVRATGAAFMVPVPAALVGDADGYVRLDVWALPAGHRAPRPAQFHLRIDEAGEVRVVGVAH